MHEDRFSLAMRRPDGVAVLSGIQWPGILAALGAVMLMQVGNQFEGPEVGFETGERILMGYLLVRSLLAGPLAIGLWRLKRWAWCVAVGDLTVVGVATALNAMSRQVVPLADNGDTAAVFLGVVVVAIWLGYLMRPTVRKSFNPPVPADG